VKPWAAFAGLRDYAGATILGDGQVAVILDVAGLALRAGLSRTGATTATGKAAAEDGRGTALVFAVSERAR